MSRIEKLNDELLKTVAGGMMFDSMPAKKPPLSCVKIGICSGIIVGFAAGAGIAKKYGDKNKMPFSKKVKTIIAGAIGGSLAGAATLGAGTIAGKTVYNFIKKTK